MAATIDLPKLDFDLESKMKDWAKELRGWNVILYNDNYNKMDNVIVWLQKATGCSLEVATDVTITAHKTGRAIAYTGGKDKCQQIVNYLTGKGLSVTLDEAV